MSGTIIPFKRQLIPFFLREMIVKLFLLLSLIQNIKCNDEKPNIIYILADDLGYGGLYRGLIVMLPVPIFTVLQCYQHLVLKSNFYSDVSFTNDAVISTPFLASLLETRRATKLTQSYSTHRCSPTRAAFLTGRYPFRYGLGSEAMTKTLPTGLDLRLVSF